jgi:hypothetical protein
VDAERALERATAHRHDVVEERALVPALDIYPAVQTEIVFVVGRQIGGREHVEVGNQRARRIVHDTVLGMHPTATQVVVRFVETDAVGELGEHVFAFRLTDDVGVREAILGLAWA